MIGGRMTGSTPQADDDNPGTFTVGRRDLTVSVTESGSIKAINSVDITCEVERGATITDIVEEGTWITPEDVNNGKVLVTLDSSQIKDRLTQKEIDFFDAQSRLTEANESLAIQENQNESDITAGERAVRFALMDLRKYLGEQVADKLLARQSNSSSSDLPTDDLIADSQLGGEALQTLRQLQSDIDLQGQELKQAESTLEWTSKLYEKEYVSLNELEADQLRKNRAGVAFKQSQTARELFVKYEFPKQVETFYSDYIEAQRELERIEARARSRLAQARAQLQSRQASFNLQKDDLARLREQLDACVIEAPAPGQVVYAREERRRDEEVIQIGTDVREGQRILSIPDTSQMKVDIDVHEMWINRVQPGQRARITIAAFPDQTFEGEVLKKAPLADQPHWMNPELKVYSTDVTIEGRHDFIKTGMSARVEIIIDERRNVLAVPIQSVVSVNGDKYCYVPASSAAERRRVQTGAFNDNFVEITRGLSAGDKVLLSPPRVTAGRQRPSAPPDQRPRDQRSTEQRPRDQRSPDQRTPERPSAPQQRRGPREQGGSA